MAAQVSHSLMSVMKGGRREVQQSRCAGLKVRFRYLNSPNITISWTRFRSKTTVTEISIHGFRS